MTSQMLNLQYILYQYNLELYNGVLSFQKVRSKPYPKTLLGTLISQEYDLKCKDSYWTHLSKHGFQ